MLLTGLRAFVLLVAAEFHRSFTGSDPETVRLSAFVSLACCKAWDVTLFFLDGSDNVGFFHSDNPYTVFDGNLFYFSECNIMSPFRVDLGSFSKG